MRQTGLPSDTLNMGRLHGGPRRAILTNFLGQLLSRLRVTGDLLGKTSSMSPMLFDLILRILYPYHVNLFNLIRLYGKSFLSLT